jgi:DNA-binding HxlR family transcriptional regulator
METNGAALTRLRGPWDPYDPSCPTRQLLDVIGDRWTVLIVGALEGRTRRFSELRAIVRGISPKVLTQSLRALERDGIVRREIFAEVPPRVEYSLTDLGRELVEPIVALRAWAETHMERILAAREHYDGADVASSS